MARRQVGYDDLLAQNFRAEINFLIPVELRGGNQSSQLCGYRNRRLEWLVSETNGLEAELCDSAPPTLRQMHMGRDDCNRLLEEPESSEADELVRCRRIA